MKWHFEQAWLPLLLAVVLGVVVTWLLLARLRQQGTGPVRVDDQAAIAPAAELVGARSDGQAGTAEARPARPSERPGDAADAGLSVDESASTTPLEVPAVAPAQAPVDERAGDPTEELAGELAGERDGATEPIPAWPAGHPRGRLVTVPPAEAQAAAPAEATSTAETAPYSAMQGLAVISGEIATSVASIATPYGPGSVLPKPDGSAPSDEYRIKGKSGSKLYHTTDSPYFGRTRAEVWFRTEADAQRAGFVAWNRKARQPRTPPTPAVEDGAYPGSAKPRPDGAAPSDEFTIKANEGSKLYHTLESPYYCTTRAEVWFRDEADAKRAGFTPWKPTP